MKDNSFLFKCLLSLCVICLAIYNLFPLQDRPFGQYLSTHVDNDRESFIKLLDQAEKEVANKKYSSLYLALCAISKENNIDLTNFFSGINLTDIKNLNKKNTLLLNILLSRSQSRIKQGLDIKGGISCILQIDQSGVNDPNFLDKAVDIIRQRIDSLGVAEPIVRKSGSNNVEVQLPGVSTQENPDILNCIKKPAKLEFRLIHANLRPKSLFDVAPIGYELLVMEHEDKDNGKIEEIPYFVKKIPEMTGQSIKSSHIGLDNFGNFEVSLIMTSEGAELFKKITSDNVNRQLGIVLDGKLYSAPVIRSAIPNGQAAISGNFSKREAFELVNVLNNPLECELNIVELNEVGPSLASDVKNSSLYAALISALSVAVFMLIYYRLSGIVSVLSIIANILIILGLMSYIGATLTLPGITALALTVGMAVDSNILVFERIREELKLGKNIRAALAAGYDKAFSSIFDANITTLIAAGVLIWFGTGPIRGFGVILAIGIFATMFCALIFSRVILEVIVNKFHIKTLVPSFHFKCHNFNFLGYAKQATWVSVLILIFSTITLFVCNKSILGIDFIGGSEMLMTFKQKIPVGDILELAKKENLGEIIAVYQRALKENNETLKLQVEEGQGHSVYSALIKAYPESEFNIIKESNIGASLGNDIKWNAFASVIISLLAMMLYVAFRFEFAYGLGAVVAIFHDVLVTIGIYILCGKQFSAPMIASILMIIGYSINDKIVIFDRIRENRKNNPEGNLVKIVNLAINGTLSRTLLTSLTTLLASVILYILGTGVIVELAFVFTLGVIVGTYSSIFIASPVFVSWQYKMLNKKISAKYA